MKRILFLLLFLPFMAFSQVVPPDATPLENIQITNNIQSTTATKATVQENNGVQNFIPIQQLPITNVPVNYSISAPQLGAHLTGIDTRLGQIGNTTAGITNRIWFTGDDITVSAGTFFASNGSGKGATASASPTALVLADNTKAYFNKDLISIAQPSTAIAPAGNYSGQLTVSATPTPNATQQRFTIEIYKTNNGGTPVASGIPGATTGDLGVTVVAILDSGIINLTAGSFTNVTVSGTLTSALTINTGERLRYHVSAAKIGAGGGNVTFGVYYGSSYSSFYDVTVSQKTSTVLNDSGVAGLTASDAFNNLNTLKANLANPTFSGALSLTNNTVGSTSNYLSQTIGGTDSWKIYGKSDILDRSEMVFELADNGGPFDSGGEKFSFKYNCLVPADSRTAFEIDYKTFTFNTGAGLTTDPSTQLDGTIKFSNISAAMAPTISGKSNSVQGFTFQAATTDTAALDMLFDVRTGSNTDFTTLTNSAYRFRRFGTTLVDIRRDGLFRIANLAGTGTRQVVADASGYLSATDVAPTSGTYTPTLTNVTNITGLTVQKASYTRIGNIINVRVAFEFNITSASVNSQFTITLPVNRTTTTSFNMGSGSVVSSNTPNNLYPCVLTSGSTSNVTVYFVPTATSSSYSGSVSFQYSILD